MANEDSRQWCDGLSVSRLSIQQPLNWGFFDENGEKNNVFSWFSKENEWNVRKCHFSNKKMNAEKCAQKGELSMQRNLQKKCELSTKTNFHINEISSFSRVLGLSFSHFCCTHVVIAKSNNCRQKNGIKWAGLYLTAPWTSISDMAIMTMHTTPPKSTWLLSTSSIFKVKRNQNH